MKAFCFNFASPGGGTADYESQTLWPLRHVDEAGLFPADGRREPRLYRDS